MKLSEEVNDFMKNHTPKWYHDLVDDEEIDIDLIGCPSKCVMGELYNWSSSYEPLLAADAMKGCIKCSAFGILITNAVRDYKIDKDDGVKDLSRWEKSMDTWMHKVIAHVKTHHPELLKEQEIAAV